MYAGAYAPNTGGVQQHTGGGYYGNGAVAGAGGNGQRRDRLCYPRNNFAGAGSGAASLNGAAGAAGGMHFSQHYGVMAYGIQSGISMGGGGAGTGGNPYRGGNTVQNGGAFGNGVAGGGASFQGGLHGKSPSYTQRYQKPHNGGLGNGGGGGGGYQAGGYNAAALGMLSIEERAESSARRPRIRAGTWSSPSGSSCSPSPKNFYVIHPNTLNMSEQAVAELRRELEITVSGNDLPHPGGQF
ncbi:GL15248 [Drosophila persimilis]|uniref:GL15248 n=1 Tax=Drosophila persimilis TaxID=7234 RepID=B4H3V5_DROPE|nr:GL15248 [Drosophila persimilis]